MSADPKKDVSMRGWIFQLAGAGAIIGKLKDETEDQLRTEIAETPTRPPVVTLFPVYILSSQLCFVQTGAGKLNAQPFRHCDTIERTFFSKGKRQPLHVALTAFEFLSEKPEDERRQLMQSLDELETSLRAAEVGIVSGSG